MKAIRNLKAEEIECRVGALSEKGLSLLLYKDARVDQNLLDECYGSLGWQRKHEKIGDSIYCTVSVKNEKGEWISKQDVGTESYSEAVKGAASDSFKRACFNFGIGRELYTAPFIWIPAEKADIRNDGRRLVSKEHFSVGHISYTENKTISELEILNKHGEIVYSYSLNQRREKKEEKKDKALSTQQKTKLKQEMKRTGVTEKEIKMRYQIDNIQFMPVDVYDKAMRALGRMKDVA